MILVDVLDAESIPNIGQVVPDAWCRNQHNRIGAGLMAIARGWRLAAHRVTHLSVSRPAQAVGRFKLVPCDAAFGVELGFSGW